MTKQQHCCTHNQKQTIKIFEAQWSNNIIAHTTKQQTMKTSKARWNNNTTMCTTKNKDATPRKQKEMQHIEIEKQCNRHKWDPFQTQNPLHHGIHVCKCCAVHFRQKQCKGLLIFGGTTKAMKWWNLTMERWWQTRAIKSYNL